MGTGENFIVVPKGIAKKTGLTGNDLLVYCLIYGFTQDGRSECYAGREYIADFINAPRLATVTDIIKRLEEKGFIKVIRVKGKGNRYATVSNDNDQYENSTSTESVPEPVRKAYHTSTESVPEPVRKAYHTSTESVPNNIEITNSQNNSDNIVPFGGNGKKQTGKKQKISYDPRKNPPTVDDLEKWFINHSCEYDARTMAENMLRHYGMIGWLYGKAHTPVVDWRYAASTWLKTEREKHPKQMATESKYAGGW